MGIGTGTGALSLGTTPAGMGGDPEGTQVYTDALQKIMDSLEARANSNNPWTVAAGFFKPTRTGGFGESLGNAVEAVGKQQEEQEKLAIPMAQMRAEMAGKTYELGQDAKAMATLTNMYTTPGVSSGEPATAAQSIFAPIPNMTVTSPMGKRTGPAGEEDHAGVDYRAPLGTPLRAPTGGTVVTAGPNGGYGNQIKVKYDNGETSTFSHLGEIGVKPGDPVKAGQTIGLTGETGNARGAHLHIEHWGQDGAKMDPSEAFWTKPTQGPAVGGAGPQTASAAAAGGVWKPDPEITKMMLVANKGKAAPVLAEIAKVNIELQKPTDTQKDLRTLADPNTPTLMKIGIASKYLGDSFKPFMVLGKNGEMQSSAIQQIMSMIMNGAGGGGPNLAVPGLGSPAGAAPASRAPVSSGPAPLPAPAGGTGVTTSGGDVNPETGFTPGSRQDLDARQKIIEGRASEKDKEWVPQRAEILAWTPSAVATYDNDLMTVNKLATKNPKVFGIMQQQGFFTALGTLAEKGLSTPWGQFSIPVSEAYAKLKFDPADQADAALATQALARIFFQNAKAYKSVLGPSISNSDSALMHTPLAGMGDSAAVVQHWVGQQLINNLHRADLYKGLLKHDATNPNAPLNSFFMGPDMERLAKSYGERHAKWMEESPLYRKQPQVP